MMYQIATAIRVHDRRGFNLVEVLIGMTILAVALASAFAMSVANAKLMEDNRSLSAAASLAEYKIEELRNQDFDSIVSGSDPGLINGVGGADSGGGFTRSWIVATGAPALVSNDLKTVVVVVNWSQWGDTRTYSLTGVIGR